MNAQEKAKQLLMFLEEKERLEIRLKEFNKDINSKCQEVADAFDDEGIGPKGIDIDGIVFKSKERDNFSLADSELGIKWDDSDRFKNFVKQNGDAGLIQVKETIPWNTREKYLKDLITSGHTLPDFIKHSVFQTIDWNKSAVKRRISDDIS